MPGVTIVSVGNFCRSTFNSHGNTIEPGVSRERRKLFDLALHRPVDADLEQRVVVQAGERRDRNDKRHRPMQSARCLCGRPPRRFQHFRAAGRVHGHHPHTKFRGRCNGASHLVRDVVELEIKEHAMALLDKTPHERGPFGSE